MKQNGKKSPKIVWRISELNATNNYEEKWYCNFGELRKITKEDLEQFEK